MYIYTYIYDTVRGKSTDIYNTCIVSRLLYGLQALWLRKAQRNQLDAFHARCLRQILRIQPSYWSRVSNQSVFDRLGAPRLTALLLEQQLLFFGKLARRPPECLVRQLVFELNLGIKSSDLVRRRGRPNLEWKTELFRIVEEMFPSELAFRTSVAEEHRWRQNMRSFCWRP